MYDVDEKENGGRGCVNQGDKGGTIKVVGKDMVENIS